MKEEIELIKKLLEIAEDNEWQTHNAAENQYCQYCYNIDLRWDDQCYHNSGCKWVEVVTAARKYLQKHEVESK